MRFSQFSRFRRRRATRLHDEIQFHRDRLIEDYIAAGLTRGEAERRAFLEFGGVPQIEEAVRDVHGRWLEDLAKDLCYAFRTLRRNAGFSVVAVLLLALGIGANVAIFSLINAVTLRTLPVKEPERLVQIARIVSDGRPVGVSSPMFEYFRDRVQSISARPRIGAPTWRSRSTATKNSSPRTSSPAGTTSRSASTRLPADC